MSRSSRRLKVVVDPDLRRDIVSLGFVKNLAIDQGRVAFTIELTTPACPVKEQMRDQATAAVRALPGVTDVDGPDDRQRPVGVGARNRPDAAAGREERRRGGRGEGRASARPRSP